MAGDTLRATRKAHNLGEGITKAQYVEATMAFIEKGVVFNTQCAKWCDIAANVRLEIGSKQVCRLKQMCMPTRAAQKHLTFIIDVFDGIRRIHISRFLTSGIEPEPRGS